MDSITQKKSEQKLSKPSAGKASSVEGRVAVIRIRSLMGAQQVVKDTIAMLHLHRSHYCSVYPKTKAIVGMINRVKDYVTYGEITEETFQLLKEKRSEVDPRDKNAIKPFFRLHPPRGGFERKGIKTPFTLGGALGYRREKINDLIRAMV
ncbi:uL30 family ribosomal protein [Candidatus Woesearchaeota archaeon]|nr:uL30 family ribosomal protein [Candidatus Woesearchaeota archaeon]